MNEAPRIKRYGGSTREVAWASFQQDAVDAGKHGWLPTSHRWGPDFLEVTYSSQPTATPRPMTVQPGEPPRRLPSFGEDPDAYVAAAVASTDPATIKLAIEMLRLKKQELAQTKKEASAQIAAIRADYSSRVAQRGSKVRGGGTLGRWARAGQTAQRDADRRSVAQAIEPLTELKETADKAARNTDAAILALRHRLLEIK